MFRDLLINGQDISRIMNNLFYFILCLENIR